MSGGYKTNRIKKLTKNIFLKKIIKLVYPPMPTLNIIPNKIIKELQHKIFVKDKLILNVGSGDNMGCGQKLWNNISTREYKIINLDIEAGPNVDLIGDAHNLNFEDNYFDVIISQATLEHLHTPIKAINEFYRTLKPGGILYIEVPFLQGFHADPHDYQRYTLQGLKILLADFKEFKSGVSVGPFCSLVWLIRDGFSSCFKNRFLYLTSRFILGWTLSPIRYLDYLIRYNDVSIRLANEYYYCCIKE